jgi:integrase
MATAKKLPSGRYRVLAYIGVGEDGKKKYKSFTADRKVDAELAANKFLNDPSRHNEENPTVKEAIERYIKAKDGVLSPSTVRGYRAMQRTQFAAIERVKVSDLTTEKMQKFISKLASESSPKYTANVYGLLTASVAMFRPDAIFRVTLPKKAVKRQISPSNDDVQLLFRSADGDLKICIALAAFGSMRRGEICALKYCDIKDGVIHIHADMVMDSENHAVYKDMPKTSESVRTVKVPSQVIELIGKGKKDEYVTHYTPQGISNAFSKLRKKIGVDGVRFHDLRHYYASIGAVLGVPDLYISDFGGWRRGSSVLKQTYQNAMPDAGDKYFEIMNSHFSELIEGGMKCSTEDNTDIPESRTREVDNTKDNTKKKSP